MGVNVLLMSTKSRGFSEIDSDNSSALQEGLEKVFLDIVSMHNVFPFGNCFCNLRRSNTP